MAGHIEYLCEHAAILRVGGAYGEPWTWAAVLRFDSPTAVTLEAVERAPTAEERRQALEVGRAAGILTYRFIRYGARGLREISHPMPSDGSC
jgi:hypothetical protein